MRQVYLDSQAATPLLPEVAEAMRPFFAEHFGSASSLHQQGLRARDARDHAREQIAAFIHAESPEEIVFTSDGTESANLAVKGAAWANQRRGRHIVAGATEHPSVLNSVEFLEGQGFSCAKVWTNGEGIIDPQEVKAALTDQTILAAIHHVNHDIGAVQAIREIGQITAERGITFYVDAEASAGWLPIDVRELGATLLSFSPHRFYGPKGVGVLYRNRRARLIPLLHGGDQENGRRAGLENIPAIVGAGVAAEIAGREQAQRSARVFGLQKQLWDGLKTAAPHIRLNGPELGPLRAPTNLNVSVEFIEGEGLALLCDMNGIAIGAGTACVSKSLRVSPTLRAIGLDASLAQGAVIFSLGKDNTADEIDYVIATLPKLVDQLRSLSPSWEEFQKREQL
jgi:cysteine desulfurase